MWVIKAWAVPSEKGGARPKECLGLREEARPITYFFIYRSNGRMGTSVVIVVGLAGA